MWNKNTRRVIKPEDVVLLNLEFIPTTSSYKIIITHVADLQLKNTFKNIFKLDKLILEVEPKNKNKAFAIKETIKCIVTKYNNGNFVCKNDGDYIRINGSKMNHYIKFSIEGRNSDKFLLSAALVVFEYYNGTLFTQYNASKLINDPKLLQTIPQKAAHYDYKENSFSINKFQSQYLPEPKAKENKRSKSTISHISSFHFNKNENEISKDEKNFLYLDIKNIHALTKSITTKIFGLENLGNTCFLNSSLQILIHSPIFIEKFLEDVLKYKPHNDTIAYEFFNFIMNIANRDSNVFSPNKIVSKFIKKCNMFSLGQQSDSQRFYRNFLTILEKEIGPYNTCIKETFLGEFIFTMENRCSNTLCGKSQPPNKVQQPFYDIFLSVPEYESAVKDLINLTYKLQIVKVNKKCSCGASINVIRNTKINPNRYFNMNIQRGKIATRNLKNTKIQIDNYYLLDTYLYEPYAINFHSGSAMDYGHYYR